MTRTKSGAPILWTLAVVTAALPACADGGREATTQLGSGLASDAGLVVTQPEGGRTVAVQPSNGSGDAASPAEAGGSDAGISSAIVPTTPIDFWQVECGAVASRTVPIENGGTAPLTVRASTTGAGFAAAPGTMTVAPAASAILTVTANVPTSATAGSPLSGSLTLETNDPSTPTIDVDLAVTPLGATLTFDPEGVPSPSEADFGPHLIGEDAQEYATIRLYLINSGNEAAVVSYRFGHRPAVRALDKMAW